MKSVPLTIAAFIFLAGCASTVTPRKEPPAYANQEEMEADFAAANKIYNGDATAYKLALEAEINADRERKAKAQADAEIERAKRLAEIEKLARAERDAFVVCQDKQRCAKAFSLTQIYIDANSTQKIQLATDTIIETYNPTELFKIGMKAIKMPQKGTKEVITLTITCRDESAEYTVLSCMHKKQRIYAGFRPFIEEKFAN